MQIRSLHEDADRRQAFALFRKAMLGIPDLGRDSPETEARFLAGGHLLGGFEDRCLRGVVNGYDASIAVPGGARVRHLSVTHVGVAPDATRRGIAKTLLTEQLRRARADGFTVAGLRASDARIYGRYGYGIASWSVRHELDLTRSRPIGSFPREDVRLVDVENNFPLFRRIADAEPCPRAATLTRWDGLWSIQEYRASRSPTPQYAVVCGPVGDERGYLRFHVAPTDVWFLSQQRTVVVDDFVAHDGEAWRALIGHLYTQDILHRAVFPSRPTDDPLPLLLDDPRAIEITGPRDESWIRPLNLDILLPTRPYRSERQVVIEIEDELLPENGGTWSIGSQGAFRSSQTPEARVSVAAAGTLFFGAQTARQLAFAGRLEAASPQTVEHLDHAFETHQKPHSGISF